jgi:hypothetical protein
MEKFQSTEMHHKKTAQDASGAQKPTLLSSLWSGLLVIISVLMIIAALKNTLTW